MTYSNGSGASSSAANSYDQQIHRLLDQLSEVVFETDATGRTTFVNAAWARTLGFSAGEILGHEIEKFVVADERDPLAAQLRQVLDGGCASCSHEVQFRTSEGETMWMALHAHGESDPQGRVVGLAGTLADITTRRKMEAELRDLAYQAQEARADAETAAQLVRAEAEEIARERDQATAFARASSEFIASMAHDLRTPLNGVLGMAECLLHSSLTEDQRDQALTVRASAESLVRLVGDIVDFSRAGAGQIEMQSEEFELRDIANDVARLLAQKAVAKGISFNTTVASTVPGRSRGDASRLRQVITNLASNAVRFTEHGSVTVAISRAPGTLTDGRVPLRIEVHDTDPTRSAEQLNGMIDQPGLTLPGQQPAGNAGLGLAIARRLVELMGGTFVVGSKSGHGSVISVEVALEPAAAAAKQTRAPNFALTMAPLDLKVLIAEDNTVNQKVAVRMLGRWGIQAVVVPDGRAAVEALEREPFDLVLMDVLMPRLNGFEATAEIREREAPTGRRTPIVAMTAHRLEQERDRCFESGMDGFVPKPIQVAELYAELAKWAEHRDVLAAQRRAA